MTFAAGMSCEGLKPVCAIYSTFLQRGFDQLIHDVCIQNLNVSFVSIAAALPAATAQRITDFWISRICAAFRTSS